MEPFFVSYMDLFEDIVRAFVATFDDLPDEALDWVPGPDMNSLCVQVVHVCGSARFWVGDVGLGEPSNRDRAAEFVTRGLSKDELKARFDGLLDYLRGAFERMPVAGLDTVRAIPNRPESRTVAWAVLHGLEHTAGHLGHAQITRQLWQQRETT
jgi:hypothetical protein